MSSKKFGDCPRCGADYRAYQFFGRWKKCFACSYDRKMEAIVRLVHHADKWGHSVSALRRNKVTEYLDSLSKVGDDA